MCVGAVRMCALRMHGGQCRSWPPWKVGVRVRGVRAVNYARCATVECGGAERGHLAPLVGSLDGAAVPRARAPAHIRYVCASACVCVRVCCVVQHSMHTAHV